MQSETPKPEECAGLVERLEAEAARNGGQGAYAWRSRELCGEAAHHIAAQDAEIARLRVIVSRVQSAAKTIMIGEADELRRLREQHREWHLAIKSLDSEREANAILTAENEALRSDPETGHD